jgi:hypothetical protein
MKRQYDLTVRCIIEWPYKYNIHLFKLDVPLWRYDIFNTGMIDCCVVLCCVVLCCVVLCCVVLCCVVLCCVVLCCVVLCCVVLCCVVFMSKEMKIRNVAFNQRYWRVLQVYRSFSTAYS